MSVLTATRNEMSFCPGCSHTRVLELLGQAIDRMGLSPEQVCLVTDIGCIGMADRYFASHTFHGLHGRSLTYAEGIKRVRPDLLVVVLIGDGGCGIGTAHVIHTARRGVGVKVIVCNNFNFGMTGGQHSVTTPDCAHTPTTPLGHHEHAFDICQTVMVNGASYVARCSALDGACLQQIESGLRTPGFALIDIWELCVAYYGSSNQLTPPRLTEMSERLGMPFGVLQDRKPAPAEPMSALPQLAEESKPLACDLQLRWPGRTEICIAGSAGQRIRSAAGTLGEIATAGGLFAAQTDDFPISVRRGHSISNLIISDKPILYAGTEEPNLVLILSTDGEQRLGALGGLRPDCMVVARDDLVLLPTRAKVRTIDIRQFEKCAGKASAALALLSWAVVQHGWLDPDTLIRAAEATVSGRYREETLQAIRAGARMPATREEHHADSTASEGAGS